MRLDDILIRRSPVHATKMWILHIEISGFKYSGYFDDFPGFLAAVTDAGGLFAQKLKGAHRLVAPTSRPLN